MIFSSKYSSITLWSISGALILNYLSRIAFQQDCLDLSESKDEKDLIATVKDIANRVRQEEGHQELARILCGWVKRVGLQRLKIEDQCFEAIHELKEFGAMLENVLPAWKERVEKEKASEIAKKMLNFNETIEKIMQFTVLSE